MARNVALRLGRRPFNHHHVYVCKSSKITRSRRTIEGMSLRLNFISVDTLPSLRTKSVTIETIVMGVATNYIVTTFKCGTEDGLGSASDFEGYFR